MELGVLKEAVPSLRRAAVLFGSDTPIDRAMLRAAGVAAQSLGIRIKAVGGARTAATIPLSAFLTRERQRRRLIGCADFIVAYERAAMSRVRVS